MNERPAPRFRRRFRGYDITLVNEKIDQLEEQIHELSESEHELRDELALAKDEADSTRSALARARAELRYWNDRASYVDSEVARARREAAELEAAARERAETIESDAQERSLQLIDRVCLEANTMLQAARDEAREMFLRFEVDVDLSQQKLMKLEKIRHDIATAMQGALSQFEDAVTELNKVAPSKRIVEELDQPVRRITNPTFGKQKALEAAKRFEERIADQSSQALSSPLHTSPLTPATDEVKAESKEADKPADKDEQETLAHPQQMVRVKLL